MFLRPLAGVPAKFEGRERLGGPVRKTTISWTLAFLVSAAVFTTSAYAQNDEVTAASGPGILPAFIAAGAPDPAGKIPNLDAVPGSLVGNLDIAQPETVLMHGQRYVYTVAMESATYTGEYSVSYRLTHLVSGKTEVLQSGTIVSNRSTKPLNYWVWVILAKAIPDSPGPATLEALITYGKETVTTSTQVLIK